MATNVSIYCPNEGEKEALRAFLQNNALVLGIYRNQVVPSGSTRLSDLTELTTGGGRGYARKELTNEMLATLRTASKWFITLNSLDKAEGQYDTGALTWTFNAVDVADAYTAYGVFAFTWVVPFDAGATEIKVGDTIKGGTSAATGIVTQVTVESGTWAAGTAAGYLNIKTKTGTWVNDENIYVQGQIATFVAAPTAAGDLYSVGDTFKIVQTGADGGVGFVLTLTGGDNTPVATIGVNPGDGGRNYTIGAGKVTAKLTGGGNDALTVEIATLSTAAYAVTNTGVTADAHQRLMAVWALSSGEAIDTNGQTITADVKISMSTAL